MAADVQVAPAVSYARVIRSATRPADDAWPAHRPVSTPDGRAVPEAQPVWGGDNQETYDAFAR